MPPGLIGTERPVSRGAVWAIVVGGAVTILALLIVVLTGVV